ncbi:MAG: FtsW/RodA/SpoVE family cell cycle protein, partial [Pseudomonadota bacterium]
MVEVALRPRSATGRLLEWQRGLDWPILMSAVLLLSAGLLLSLAAGPPAAERLGYADSFYFVKRHAMFVGAAVSVLVGVSLLDRVWARRLAALVFFASVVLLAFILVSGYEAKGARRWIRIGSFGLQPSEFAKPALIVL